MTKMNTSQVFNEKKPIAPVIKNMSNGEIEVYGSDRYTTIKSTVQILHTRYPERRWKTTLMRDKSIVLVTRTS